MSKLHLPLVKKTTPPPSVVEGNPYELFLKVFLGDGPRARTNVYREAEDRHLVWEHVKSAFAALHGQEYVQRGDVFWRLPPA